MKLASLNPVRMLALAALISVFGACRYASAVEFQLVGVDLRLDSSNQLIELPSSLYDINISTGAASNARITGASGLIGIAVQPATGKLYSMSAGGNPPFDNALLTLDVATGQATFVGHPRFGAVEGDIAFQPTTGSLFGLVTYVPSASLFTLNPATGAQTIVGAISPAVDPSALAFGPTGVLYTIDDHDAGGGHGSVLETLNPLAGAVLSSVALSRSLGVTMGMAFDPSTGVAYVADGGANGTDNLYTLDTATGVLTLVGPLGLPGGLSGLAFVHVPEPGSLALAAFGLLGSFAWGRRRNPR